MNNFKINIYKKFANGMVFALYTEDLYPIETTDTFLPMITLDAEQRGTNTLVLPNFGSRKERWMIGVSVMSGCPVRCPFCATGALKKWRNLTANEISQQVQFIVDNNTTKPNEAKEFKVLFTRMGEPVFNKQEVIKAIRLIKEKWPNVMVAISTVAPLVGTKEFIDELGNLVKEYQDDFIQLQFSVHSTSDKQRDFLQPVKKYKIKDLRKFTNEWKKISKRKITLNFTLCDDNEFLGKKIKKYFTTDSVFIKLSPLNENIISKGNKMTGIITAKNLA